MTERPDRSPKKITGPLAKSLAKAQTAPPRWYTIQSNDSLRSIAKRQLRDEERWREIAALNPALRDANRLRPGTRIKLPPPLRVASR
jgi:nucleoid-associated protein YgaU